MIRLLLSLRQDSRCLVVLRDCLAVSLGPQRNCTTTWVNMLPMEGGAINRLLVTSARWCDDVAFVGSSRSLTVTMASVWLLGTTIVSAAIGDLQTDRWWL